MAVSEVGNNDFEDKVIEGSRVKPCVVDFWAPWCGPCRMVGPVLEELSNEMSTISFYKLNTDDNQETASKFGVMSIPTMIIFKNGEPIDRIVGATTKSNLKEKFETHVAEE